MSSQEMTTLLDHFENQDERIKLLVQQKIFGLVSAKVRIAVHAEAEDK